VTDVDGVSAEADRRSARGSSGVILATFKPWLKPMSLLIVLSSIATFFEVGALGMLVLLAKLLADGTGTWTGTTPLGFSITLTALQIGALGALIVVLRLAIQALNAFLEARIATSYLATQRKRLFGSYVRSSWDAKAATPAADLQLALTTNLDNSVGVLQSFAGGVVAAANVAVLLASAMVFSPIFAIAILAGGVALFVGFRPVTAIARRFEMKSSESNTRYAREVAQAVDLAQEVEVFGVGGAVEKSANRLVDIGSPAQQSANFAAKVVSPLYQSIVLLVSFAALIAIIFAGFARIETVGVVVIIMLRVTSYAQTLQSAYHQVVWRGVYLERLKELGDGHDQAPATTGDVDPGPLKTVGFDGVSFAYASSNAEILHGVSFRVDRGEMVGIIGPSGAGKSTLVRLLLGLHRPARGRVLINDVSLASIARAAWSKRVAFVPQETSLLAGTIGDNVRFHREGFSDDDVVRACKAASIHEAIAAMPEGYATRVGVGEGDLSVGQRQRISIARALLAEPDLLVLDEPTSALDPVSEIAISDALAHIHGKTTVFVIAHRLQTIDACDRILVLEHGVVSAFDKPKIVASENKFYRHHFRPADHPQPDA
jgi:ATP-binding cassette subfamily B protein